MRSQISPRIPSAPSGSVRWPWLAVPGLAVVFGLVFMAYHQPGGGPDKALAAGTTAGSAKIPDLRGEVPGPIPEATAPEPTSPPVAQRPGEGDAGASPAAGDGSGNSSASVVPNPMADASPAPDVPAVVGPVEPARVIESLAAAVLDGKVEAIRAELGMNLVNGLTYDSLGALLGEDGYALDAANAVSQLGSQPTLQRWALHLRKRSDQSQVARLELDFSRDPQGRWWPSKLHLPSAEETRPASPVADPAARELAGTFIRSLLAADFFAAMETMDGARVSPAALAGLAILISEGGFAPKGEDEMQTTVANRNSAWFIIPVVSEHWKTESQFGLVLQRGAGDAWKVTALNLDNLLAVAASRVGGGDAAFSSYIRSGRAGDDALAIYFEPKSTVPDARGKKVLALAAKLLAADPTLKVRLDGHGDALEKEGVEKPKSKARAAAAQALITADGLNPERVTIETHGASRPRRANFRPDGTEDPAARRLNRRVEIHFLR